MKSYFYILLLFVLVSEFFLSEAFNFDRYGDESDDSDFSMAKRKGGGRRTSVWRMLSRYRRYYDDSKEADDEYKPSFLRSEFRKKSENRLMMGALKKHRQMLRVG